MDRNGVTRLSEVESSASHSAGAVELWHGAGQVVWHYAGMCRTGRTTGLFRSEPGTTLARMVLWRQRQKGGQAPRTGGEPVFCPVVAVDPGPLISRDWHWP